MGSAEPCQVAGDHGDRERVPGRANRRAVQPRHATPTSMPAAPHSAVPASWEQTEVGHQRSERAVDGLESLIAVPMLAVLPEHVIERPAQSSGPGLVPAGRAAFEQGDEVDRFFIVESCDVEVSSVGQPVARLGEGGSFGEIALRRDVPRAATVVAITDVAARTIERCHFLATVTGHADPSEQAELVVGRHMDAF